MDTKKLIEQAIEMAAERRAHVPSFPLYVSIEGQLGYMKRVLDGHEKDRSRLKDIIVGVYAVREFDESDPEFARLLKEAQLVAYKMAKGLKV